MRVVDHFLEQCRLKPHARALQVLAAADRPGDGRNSDGRLRTTCDVTWAELERLMVRTAGLLQTAGDRKWQVGDRVATWLPNGLAWILVDMACQWLGYIHVALDTRLPLSMALDLVDHSQAILSLYPSNGQTTLPRVCPCSAPKRSRLARLSIRALSSLSCR